MAQGRRKACEYAFRVAETRLWAVLKSFWPVSVTNSYFPPSRQSPRDPLREVRAARGPKARGRPDLPKGNPEGQGREGCSFVTRRGRFLPELPANKRFCGVLCTNTYVFRPTWVPSFVAHGRPKACEYAFRVAETRLWAVLKSFWPVSVTKTHILSREFLVLSRESS